MNNEDNIIRATGLARNSNDIVLPPGSLVAADECNINKDNIISRRRGFLKCATGLPAAKPEQMFVSNGQLYVHINNQLWHQTSDPCVYADIPGSPVTFNQPYALWGDANELYVASLDNTIRKISFTQQLTVTLVAGQPGVAGFANGTGAAATFNSPRGLFGDATNLYVSDHVNGAVRKIVRATRVVTTLTAGLNFPVGLTLVGGFLYVCESNGNVITQIDVATGIAAPFSGSGIQGIADGAAGVCEYDAPWGITYQPLSSVFWVVQNNWNSLRVIDAAVVTSTIPNPFDPSVNNRPSAVIANGTDYVISNNVGSDAEAIAGIVPGGVGATFAGGYRDGAASVSWFDQPNGIFIVGSYMYVADTNNQVIRRVELATGVTSTYLGTAGVAGSADSAFLPPLIGPA